MTKHLDLTDRRGHVLVQDPPIAQLLFCSTKMAWLWLAVRLWVGYQWLTSGWGKLNNPDWMASGKAIRAYWERAVVVPDAPAKPPVAFDWYRDFLNLLLTTNSDVWFSKVIVAGELLVGLGLVTGALVGIAAFGGGLMNWSFLMAGTVSTNPLLFALTGLLILAWKNAGYLGLDRYLLPLLGTPWKQATETEEAPTPKAPSPKRGGMAIQAR